MKDKRIMIMMYCAGTSSGGTNRGEKGTWRIHRAAGTLICSWRMDDLQSLRKRPVRPSMRTKLGRLVPTLPHPAVEMTFTKHKTDINFWNQ